MNIKLICLASVFAVALPAAAFADMAAEMTTAQTHAGLAGKAADIMGVHMHLHHALNCLVGPSGDGFDATNANPCAKSGNGLIPDATDAAQKTKLMAAVAKAKAGIAESDVDAAKKDAADTAAAIAGSM